jgi:glycosyltransferase involved in cell wall biosynthesis
MRVALIAPPFISVLPKVYGGTELFIGHLAVGLDKLGIEVIVYTNGESTVPVEKRWLYENSQWPIKGEVYDNLKDINHTSWAIVDAVQSGCDVIHLNNVPGLVHSRSFPNAFVYTIHHPHEEGLSEFYQYFPQVRYVTISHFQREREKMPHVRAIYHGIDFSQYRFCEKKQNYLSFIGRIAPMKGTHLAIAVARKARIPLKIAGEVQPMYREYFQREIEPHLDGRLIQYVGEADLAAKNELLGNSLAMLFPIQWDEPFGLVLIEAMACGTPVLALPGGSVPEIVKDGVAGYVCRSVDEMAMRARQIADGSKPQPAAVRRYVEQHFSLERMISEYTDLYAEAVGRKAEKQRAIA